LPSIIGLLQQPLLTGKAVHVRCVRRFIIDGIGLRPLLRHSLGTLALILTSLLLPMTLNAKAETALEVQSWCQDIIHAELTTDKRVLFEPRYVTGFCWGVFGALQEVSRLPVEIDGHMYLLSPTEFNESSIY
jgi:hypothetical protein